MPIASDSVDVVLMPHVLEFESSPHDALRETFRVLVPGGHAVISVFNPLSMMGVWRVFRRHRRRAPWNGQFFTLSRLRDWLVLLGFDIVTTRPCFFAPPLRSASLVTRCLEAEPVCRRLFPYLAGVHVVLARKRVFAITPLRPKWDRPRRLLAGGLVEPTTRSQDDA